MARILAILFLLLPGLFASIDFGAASPRSATPACTVAPCEDDEVCPCCRPEATLPGPDVPTPCSCCNSAPKTPVSPAPNSGAREVSERLSRLASFSLTLPVWADADRPLAPRPAIVVSMPDGHSAVTRALASTRLLI
jgi:hypothetical protein